MKKFYVEARYTTELGAPMYVIGYVMADDAEAAIVAATPSLNSLSSHLASATPIASYVIDPDAILPLDVAIDGV